MAKTFDVNVDTIFAAEKFARLTLISQAVEALVSPDQRRRGFFRIAGAAAPAYKALLPDDRAAPYLKRVATLHHCSRGNSGKARANRHFSALSQDRGAAG